MATCPEASGGSPYQIFANEKMKLAKEMATAADRTRSGSLTAAALQKVRDRCVAEWRGLTDSERAPWREVYAARLEERRRVAVERVDVGSEPQGGGPVVGSHWGFGSQHDAVCPDFMRSAFEATQKLPPCEEVYAMDEFTIASAAEVPFVGADIQIDPCHLMGRPVCKRHERYEHLSRIHDGMKIFTDRLGKSVVSTGDILCLFEARRNEGVHREFALLTHASFSPKFQDWTLCRIFGPSPPSPDLEFPFEVELDYAPLPVLPGAGTPSRMALRHETSDHLACRLSGLAQEWRLRPCCYQLLSPSRMRITGVEAAEELDIRCGAGKGAPRRRGGAKPGLPAEVSEALALHGMGDPVSGGDRVRRGVGGAQRQLAPRSGRHRPPPAPIAAPLSSSSRLARQGPAGSDDEDLFGPLEEESDGQAEECQAHRLQEPPSLSSEVVALGEGLLISAAGRADLMEDPCPPDGDGDAFEHLRPALSETVAGSNELGEMDGPVANDLGAGPTGGAAELASVIDIAAELSGVIDASDGGVEAETIAPESAAASSSQAMPEIANKPEVDATASAASQSTPTQAPPVVATTGEPISGGPEGWTMTPKGYVFCSAGRYRGRITSWGGNVSAKCALHGCSKAKRRAKISDGELAQWLARGVAECPLSDGDVKTMGKQHILLFPM